MHISPSENLLQHGNRRPDLNKHRGILDYMDKVLLWALTNPWFLDIILTKIERHHDLHEPLIGDYVLLPDDQVDQLLFLLGTDSKHVGEDGAHFVAG